jgi:hypothetical protein
MDPAPPVRIALERERMKMCGDMTGTARIAIPVPDAAEVIALLDNQEIFAPGFEQLDAPADAGKASRR